MTIKKWMAGTAVCAAVVLGASGSAFAGEVTGKGKVTAGPAHAKSLCVFSGLEDEPLSPGTTQNWGQIVREAGPLGGAADVPLAGEGCNAHLYPNK